MWLFHDVCSCFLCNRFIYNSETDIRKNIIEDAQQDKERKPGLDRLSGSVSWREDGTKPVGASEGRRLIVCEYDREGSFCGVCVIEWRVA